MAEADLPGLDKRLVGGVAALLIGCVLALAVLLGPGVGAWLWIFVAQAVAWSLACAHVAAEKHRDAPNWGLIGFLLGVVAFLVLLVVPDPRGHDERTTGGQAR